MAIVSLRGDPEIALLGYALSLIIYFVIQALSWFRDPRHGMLFVGLLAILWAFIIPPMIHMSADRYSISN
jgi:hypothetical protein